MDFEVADNWGDVPGLKGKEVSWTKIPRTPERYAYHARIGDEDWWLRRNNFPDEPFYTLIIDGREIIHFNDPPAGWNIL